MVRKNSGNEITGLRKLQISANVQVGTGMWRWWNISVRRHFFLFFKWRFVPRVVVLIQKCLIFILRIFSFQKSLFSYFITTWWNCLSLGTFWKLEKVPRLPLWSAGNTSLHPSREGSPNGLASGAPVWFVSRGQVSLQAKKKTKPKLITFSIFHKTTLPPFCFSLHCTPKEEADWIFKHIWTLFL